MGPTMGRPPTTPSAGAGNAGSGGNCGAGAAWTKAAKERRAAMNESCMIMIVDVKWQLRGW